MNLAPLIISIFTLICKCMNVHGVTGCSNSLGMANGDIKNAQITSERWLYSTMERNRHFRPYFARLDFDQRGGGWCSDDVDKYPNQHLDVDLLINTKLTSLAMQGKAGGGEYVDSFYVSYRRENDTEFRKFQKDGKWKLFTANNATTPTARITFDYPIIASQIRLYPKTSEFSVLCMRLELYGCEWTKKQAGLITYTASGVTEVVSNGNNDNTYDGVRTGVGSDLKDGLGRLTDDVVPKFLGVTQEWVAFASKSPSVTFEFATTTSFNQVTCFALNNDMNTGSFKSATFFTSEDGITFNMVQMYEATPDIFKTIGIVPVIIKLENASGRFLKIQLKHSSLKLYIAEFSIKTGGTSSTGITPVKAVSTESPSTVSLATRRVFTRQPIPEQKKTTPIPFILPTVKFNTGDNGGSRFPTKSEDKPGISFPIILTIVLVGVVVMAIVGIMVVRQCRKSMRPNEKSPHYPTKSAAATSELLYEEKISLQGSSHVRYYPTAANNVRQPYRTT